MMDTIGVGSLFSGLIQGMIQGQQAQTDLQHKKDLLKLEQDKIKLQERESQLHSATSLQTALIGANSAMQTQQLQNQGAMNVEQARAKSQSDINEANLQNVITTTGMRISGEQAQEKTRQTGELERTKLALTAPSPAEKTINYLVKSGIPLSDAADIVLRPTDESNPARLIAAYTQAHAMSGAPTNFVELNQLLQTLEQYKTGFGGAKVKTPPTFDLGNIDKYMKK